MTLSELAEAANLPVATVKYYLREGLLPPGTPVTRTRADYSAGHLDRLRLVRALVDAAGLSIADARRIVAVVDDPPQRRSELLGIAHGALPSRHRDHEVSDEARRFVAGLGWTFDPDTPRCTTSPVRSRRRAPPGYRSAPTSSRRWRTGARRSRRPTSTSR